MLSTGKYPIQQGYSLEGKQNIAQMQRARLNVHNPLPTQIWSVTTRSKNCIYLVITELK